MSDQVVVTSGEYIQHHLEHLTLNLQPGLVGGFWTINLDTLFVSAILAILLAVLLRYIAVNMHPGVPSRMQNFVEIVVAFVQKTVHETYHGKSELIAPLALVVFLWIFCMKINLTEKEILTQR